MTKKLLLPADINTRANNSSIDQAVILSARSIFNSLLSHVRRQGIARSFSLRRGGWRGSWMRIAGNGTRRRRLNKLSCADWVPHDRGSVLGCLALGSSIDPETGS